MIDFIYCPNPTSETPTIIVGGKIGDDVLGTQFAKEIYALANAGKKTIQIEINSEGGEVFNGYQIHCSILEVQEKYGVSIITLNGGIAASIAGCFSQAGNRRIMYDYSRLMLHNPFTSDGSDDKGLEAIRLSLVTLISKRSGLSEDKVSEIMARTSWISAEEALSLGLCDEIKSSTKMDKKTKAELLNSIEKKTKQYLNSINNKNKQLNMNKDLIKILNDAGSKVNDDSSDEEVMDAIGNLIKPVINDDAMADDKCNDDDSKKMDHFPGEPSMPGVVSDDLIKKMDDLTKKYDDLKKVYDKVMEDNLNMMKIIKAKEEKEFNDSVEKIISDGIKIGKIHNSAIETCRLMAKADLDTFKKWVDIQPINKVAPVIEARDFLNETEKSKNEAEVNKMVNKTTTFDYGTSFLMNKSAELMNKMNDSYNPKNIK